MTYHLVCRIVLLIIPCFIFQACKNSSTPPPPPPTEVNVVTVKKETIPYVYDSVGYAESSHLVEIRARVEGYLEEIAYVEGSRVEIGDLLFKLDQRNFVAAVEQAKGSLEREKALLWNAKQTVDRLTPLYEKHAASKKDLDDATASLLASQASVQTAQASLDSAQINLSYTVITSPIQGLAGKSNFREGALISPGPSNLMTTVNTLDPIWVYFSISENQMLKIEREISNHTLVEPKDKNYVVEVLLADGSLFAGRGKVDFAAPTYDQKTGTLTLRAQFPNPKNILRPGQFVRVKVLGAIRPNAIFVPQKAVLEGKSGMFVYVVRDGKAAIQNVVVGDWYGDNWIVKEGLKEGEQVIVDGVNKVHQDSHVKVSAVLPLKKDKAPSTTPFSEF
jgi:membrane fusion protein (multidrug efflux system)